MNRSDNENVNYASPQTRNYYGSGRLENSRNPYEDRNFILNEKRKYKEDLDYLISLRRRLGEEEFQKRYGNYFKEFTKRIEMMNEKLSHDAVENKTFQIGLMKEYENDILFSKDKERQQKLTDLEKDKKYLETLDYQQYLDKQRRMERKMKLKDETIKGLDEFYQKKHAQEADRYEDTLMSKKLIEEQNRIQDARDMQYRNKLNNMNEKIYDNALKYSGYIQNSGDNLSPKVKVNEPFFLKNDHEFNRRVAEMRLQEKENIKNDHTMINERLRDLDRLKEFESKIKSDKFEHQKMYKDYLDHQRGYNINSRTIPDDEPKLNPMIMPAYYYPNLPIPNSKKAVDSINWVKNNHTETLSNGVKASYLGESTLRHNPILQPMNNFEYNKYLNQQRKAYGSNNHNHNLLANSIERNELTIKNDKGTFAKVGNTIMA